MTSPWKLNEEHVKAFGADTAGRIMEAGEDLAHNVPNDEWDAALDTWELKGKARTAARKMAKRFRSHDEGRAATGGLAGWRW